MFKLTQKDTYKRNINVAVPLDMGKVEKQTFIMEFQRLSVSETKDLIDEATNGGVTDEDMIRRYCRGWEGIRDEDGVEVPYTDKNLEMVMDVPYVRKAIMSAFVEDVFGREASRKNS